MRTNGKLLIAFLFSLFISINPVTYGQDKEAAQTSSTPKKVSTQTTQAKSKTAQTGSATKKVSSKSTQTKSKSAQTGSKAKQAVSKPKPSAAKPVTKAVVRDTEAARIGMQSWAMANLDVSTFRNGDTIPQAKTNEEWVAAGQTGKPAWCYYNNDPTLGKKYGKLYNWYAVNDPRGLAPAGWDLPDDEAWMQLATTLGGPQTAGLKMKSITGWADGNNGSNESGFNGLPGGYRKENGIFSNIGSIGIWWGTSEGKGLTAFDYFLILNSTLSRSSNPRLRGESVRCIRR